MVWAMSNTVSSLADPLLPIPADRIWRNIGQLLTLEGDGPADIGLIAPAALAARNGRVVWTGPDDQANAMLAPVEDARTFDVGGRLVTPGFVDPHTHLVWAGQRAAEFH